MTNAQIALELGVEDPTRGRPPGPKRMALLRSMHWFRDPIGFVHRWERRYGRVFCAPLGPRRNATFVGDPWLVRAILTADQTALRAGDANGLMRPVLGPASLLVTDDDEHRHHRRLMLPSFHKEYVRRFAQVIREIAAERVWRWPRDEPIALHEEMREIAFSAILRVVLGMREQQRERRLRELFPQVMDGCSSPLTLTPYFRRELGGLSPYGKLLNTVAELDEVLNAEIRERTSDPALEDRDDALAMMIRGGRESGLPLSDSELRDELMTMLVAGHETTAAALSWAFERLARHPDVIERIASDPDDLGYLDAVIKEILRQRPLVPALVRKLTLPAALGEWGFPAGWVLMPSVFSVHHDETIYPEPERFLPERFLGPDAPPAWAWIPFGGGIRRCVGASLAMFEMRLVLQTVLQKVIVRPTVLEPERIVRRRFTLAPEADAEVVVTSRRVATHVLPMRRLARARAA